MLNFLATPPPEFTAPPRRILIIKPSAIGDVVHGLPILNLLRLRWPDAHITWLVTPACAGLLRGHPQLNEVILFDRKRWAKSWRSVAVARELFGFFGLLRSKKFDLVIDLQGLFRSGWMARMTRAPFRVGATDAREMAWIFYTNRVATELEIRNPNFETRNSKLQTRNKSEIRNPKSEINPNIQNPKQATNGSFSIIRILNLFRISDFGFRISAPRHAVDRYLNVADYLSLGTSPVKFVFPTDDQDRATVAGLLPQEPFAVLLPATNWPTKQWPIERFAALVEPLNAMGLHSVLAGGTDAAAMADRLPGAINLAGKTSLRELVAVLEKAAIVIANDTGPMHIAAALGRPLVTVFGPTSPHRTGPYQRDESVVRLDIACSPCFSRSCSHHSCMIGLGIEPVMELVRLQLGEP